MKSFAEGGNRSTTKNPLREKNGTVQKLPNLPQRRGTFRRDHPEGQKGFC
jgi:hypothetical protein